MNKVLMKILQGSVVTQTELGGLTVYPPVANLKCILWAKNYENCLEVDKVIATVSRLTFSGPPCKCPDL